VRYSSIQITGTFDQPFFYPTYASDSVASFIRREFALAGVLEGGIEMYLEKTFSRAALIPETHPLFNCDVIYSVVKSSDFSKESIGTTKQYKTMDRMIENEYIVKLLDLIETARSKNKKP
jgi:hypothetical protein